MDMTPQVQKYLQEMADATIEIDAQREQQKSIVESAEESCGVDKQEFKEAARLYYLKKYDPEKYEKAKGKAEILDVIDGVDV